MRFLGISVPAGGEDAVNLRGGLDTPRKAVMRHAVVERVEWLGSRVGHEHLDPCFDGAQAVEPLASGTRSS